MGASTATPMVAASSVIRWSYVMSVLVVCDERAQVGPERACAGEVDGVE
jgi:hypothetical protein